MSSFVAPEINFLEPVPSDIEISQSITPLPIEKIAEYAGLLKEEIFPYGSNKCKISLAARARLANQEDGNYVVVTGINPTP
jgi:formyltetrahydrofolate synthetase